MAGMEPDPTEMIDEFETAGSNQTGMRQRNERLVLSLLRRLGPLPKAEIARKTGLSAQTVSVIMRALEKDGLLEKGEKLRGKVGQPSVPMRLAPNGALFLGLKVGRRSAEMILVNFVGEELGHVTRAYSYPTPEATLAFARAAVDEICAG
ncbi:MAG: winged helix-turn-helix transcriptional regulator, partial [Pseudomonadota bacterium]